MPIKARSALYWTTTTLTALVPCLSGGAANLLHAEEPMRGMVALGYPPYVLTILGGPHAHALRGGAIPSQAGDARPPRRLDCAWHSGCSARHS